MKELLEGIRVLDFTNNYAGPEAASTLADYGADVIHIEKPVYGDDCRFFSPMIDGTSTSHCGVNRNKKSVVINLKDPEIRPALEQMISEADVIIESYRPGVMDKLGLGYEDASRLNPKIIYCSVSIFGHSGPYAGKAGYDVIAQAYSGLMNATGTQEGGPTKIGMIIGDGVGKMNAFASIMAALYYRQRTGEGQFIDVSLARGLIWIGTDFNHVPIPGYSRKRTGNFDSQLCPYGIFHGSNDESIVIGAVNANLWKKLCDAMERPELADDPRFRTNDVRVDNSKEVISIVETWLKTFPDVRSAAARLDEFGVPNCKVYTFEDLYEDEHANACGWIKTIPTPPSVTSAEYVATVMGNADYSKFGVRVGRAADLGEHDHEVLSKYGLSDEKIDELERKWAQKV